MVGKAGAVQARLPGFWVPITTCEVFVFATFQLSVGTSQSCMSRKVRNFGEMILLEGEVTREHAEAEQMSSSRVGEEKM